MLRRLHRAAAQYCPLSSPARGFHSTASTCAPTGGPTDAVSEDNNQKHRFQLLAEKYKQHQADKFDIGSQDAPEQLQVAVTSKAVVQIPDRIKNSMATMHMENPTEWTVKALAGQFKLSRNRVEAILYLKKQEFEAFGVLEDADEESETNPSLEEPRRWKMYKGVSDFNEDVMPLPTPKRPDPLFAFLNDEEAVAEMSHLVDADLSQEYREKRQGNRGYHTVEEVQALQDARQDTVITPMKDFSLNGAKPLGAKSYKYKIAMKDLSKGKKKAPLVVRDEQGQIRMATVDEAVKRTWVKRPKAFKML